MIVEIATHNRSPAELERERRRIEERTYRLLVRWGIRRLAEKGMVSPEHLAEIERTPALSPAGQGEGRL